MRCVKIFVKITARTTARIRGDRFYLTFSSLRNACPLFPKSLCSILNSWKGCREWNLVARMKRIISFYRRATEHLKASYSEGGPRGRKENSSKRNRQSFDTILSQFLFFFGFISLILRNKNIAAFYLTVEHMSPNWTTDIANLVAKIFYFSPWRPIWSRVRALSLLNARKGAGEWKRWGNLYVKKASHNLLAYVCNSL